MADFSQTAGEKAQRLKQFKNSGRHEEMRRRRAEGSIELRKARKEEQMSKRRNLGADHCADDDSSSIETKIEDEDALSGKNNDTSDKLRGAGNTGTFEKFVECRNRIIANSNNEKEIAAQIELIRKLLSKGGGETPVQLAIDAGVLPLLVSGLQCDCAQIQYDSAWAMTNILTGTREQTALAVNSGVVEPMLNLLRSSNRKVAEQACWGISNIVGDCAEFRDRMISAGLIDILCDLSPLAHSLTPDFVRTIAWLISNICRHKHPRISIDALARILPHIKMLMLISDKSALVDSIWALTYITDGSENYVEQVIGAGFVSHLCSLICNDEPSIVAPALRALGNIVSGNDSQTQAVIDGGALSGGVFKILSTSSRPNQLKEACWLISNIAAGTPAQIQAIIDAKLLPLFERALRKGDIRVRVEVSWCINNLAHGGRPEQVIELANCGLMVPICDCLATGSDAKLILSLLDSIMSILRLMGRSEEVQLMIEECGGLDKLEALQHFSNDDVYKLALQIIEQYFADDDYDDDNKENGACSSSGKQPLFNF